MLGVGDVLKWQSTIRANKHSGQPWCFPTCSAPAACTWLAINGPLESSSKAGVREAPAIAQAQTQRAGSPDVAIASRALRSRAGDAPPRERPPRRRRRGAPAAGRSGATARPAGGAAAGARATRRVARRPHECAARQARRLEVCGRAAGRGRERWARRAGSLALAGRCGSLVWLTFQHGRKRAIQHPCPAARQACLVPARSPRQPSPPAPAPPSGAAIAASCCRALSQKVLRWQGQNG